MEKISSEELKDIATSIAKLIENGQLIVLISNATDEGNTELVPIVKDTSPSINGSRIQIDLSDQCMGTLI